MRSSASYSLTDSLDAALFFRNLDENPPPKGVCLLSISPSVGSRAELHSQLLEVIHSFASSLTNRLPFPLRHRHQYVQHQIPRR